MRFPWCDNLTSAERDCCCCCCGVTGAVVEVVVDAAVDDDEVPDADDSDIGSDVCVCGIVGGSIGTAKYGMMESRFRMDDKA